MPDLRNTPTGESYPTTKGYKIDSVILQDKIGEGGSVVLVKDVIKSYQEDNLETKQMQVTTVCIQATPMNIIMAVVYCLTRFKLKKKIRPDLKKLDNCLIIKSNYNAGNTF